MNWCTEAHLYLGKRMKGGKEEWNFSEIIICKFISVSVLHNNSFFPSLLMLEHPNIPCILVTANSQDNHNVLL